MSTIEEPTESRPWRTEDGPQPEVWTWPNVDCPALYVWASGAWRYGRVQARQNYADGRVVYLVEADLRGDTTVTVHRYAWPQPGLRVAHGSSMEPSRGVDEANQGDMPRPASRKLRPSA
ncbi:hypothetical protein [Streptomyces sp. NPDC006640]|uniref:hypothetical protein n=1 Tax=unclassified Streptomyces TaxID=2593676 RepID=UPI0036C947C7